ncbi:MAG TPA: hypothetical protein VJ877_05985 [Bacteroidales bacterium]|nr:hypothetical protein [Bacteroidales bacterium]
MKYSLTALAVFLQSFIFCGFSQDEITPLDSLFTESVVDFYRDAENNAGEIWPGMTLSPVCLYRHGGPAILYGHPDPPGSFVEMEEGVFIGEPADLKLFGSTQVDINGTLTAIADYGMSPFLDVAEVYAILFHEMHHAYQVTGVSEIKYDDASQLMTYPEIAENDAVKLYEQECLFSCYQAQSEEEFRKWLNRFYSCRLYREGIINRYTDYEQAVESFEGPALYCEYKYFMNNSVLNEALKQNYAGSNFFSLVTEPRYGRDNLRQRHLGSGLVMALVLDKYYEGWEEAYYDSDMTLFDYFTDHFKPSVVELDVPSEYYSLAEFHTGEIVKTHRENLSGFYDSEGEMVVVDFKNAASVKGFDPMNAESVNDSTIINKTLLKLAGGKNEFFALNKRVVSFYSQSMWRINRIVFFVPEGSVVVKEGNVRIETGGIKMHWENVETERSSNIIKIKCI